VTGVGASGFIGVKVLGDGMTVAQELIPPEVATVLPDDQALVLALQRGDESAFVALVQEYQGLLIRLALPYVAHRAMAEDVVQETWLGVLRGLERFEARSSLKTWICRILVNRARTRAQRDGRLVPFSSFAAPDDEGEEPAVDPARFYSTGQNEGHWISMVQSWEDLPEESLLSEETRQRVQAAIEALPTNQRSVITLRDIEGWQSSDVCAALEISEANQRVLLHRARGKVRQALERYFEGA
jgi:RNA polymerase sigma-70 factor (ECF subfamily)